MHQKMAVMMDFQNKIVVKEIQSADFEMEFIALNIQKQIYSYY